MTAVRKRGTVDAASRQQHIHGERRRSMGEGQPSGDVEVHATPQICHRGRAVEQG